MTYIQNPGTVPLCRTKGYQLYLPFPQRPQPKAKAKPAPDPTQQKIAANLNRLETHKEYSIIKVRQMYAKHLAKLGHSASYDELHWTHKAKADKEDLEIVYQEMAKVLDEFKRK